MALTLHREWILAAFAMLLSVSTSAFRQTVYSSPSVAPVQVASVTCSSRRRRPVISRSYYGVELDSIKESSNSLPHLLRSHRIEEHSDNNKVEGEDFSMIRQMATDALIPVFYTAPDIHNDNTGKENVLSLNQTQRLHQSVPQRPISPEKALKKVLRQYQSRLVASAASGTKTSYYKRGAPSFEERSASRKLLSDLVLGTSVMRIRHFYVLQQQQLSRLSQSQRDPTGTETPGAPIEPITGCGMMLNSNDVSSGESNPQRNTTTQSLPFSLAEQNIRQDSRRKTTRAMIDLHAAYLQEHTTSGIDGAVFQDPHAALFTNLYQAERISLQYSVPSFLVDLLVRQYGLDKTEDLAAVFNQAGPITLRRNAIRCPSDEMLLERLWNEESVRVVPMTTIKTGWLKTLSSVKAPRGCLRMLKSDPNDDDDGDKDRTVPKSRVVERKSIWSMQTWKDGWFEVQDAGSQLIAEATEAKCGEVVVDYCAGNGGKTLALLSQLQMAAQHPNDGETTNQYWNNSNNNKNNNTKIIAHDVVEERLRQLKGSLPRVGLASEDGVTPNLPFVATTLEQGDQLRPNFADVVLVDAPCSSIGVLRRRPSHRFSLTEIDISDYFPSLQLQILSEASTLVKPGGRLVYATCSILECENENVVKKFESSGKFIDERWERWDFNTSFTGTDDSVDASGAPEMAHSRALLPTLDGSDGFFIARWRRSTL